MPDWLQTREVHEAEPSMLAGMSFLAGLCVLFGLAPQLLMQWVVAPAVNGLGFHWEVTLSWLGLQTTSAGVQVTLGAGIAVVAVLVGLLVYSLTRPAKVGPAPVGLFTGGDPLPVTNGVSVVDFAALTEISFDPVYKVTNPDLLYQILWKGIKKMSSQLERLLRPASETYPLLAALLMTGVVIVAVWLL
jgi:multicomponent Na+:H+ antiporter subunit A